MQLRSLILPIAIILSIILYYPTHHYGLVTDYLGWLNKYRAGDWTDILSCFGYHGLHQFFHLVNYTIFSITGADTFWLYLIFAISHGVVAYIVYRSLRKIGEYIDWENAGVGAFFAALLFLFSPYQAEVVTWKACYHYMMVTALIGVSTIYWIKYLEGDSKALYVHLMLFILSLFTLEISLVSPGIYGLIYLLRFWQTKNKTLLKKGILSSLAHLAFLILYFLLTKLVIGNYIGHYGAEKHANFDVELLMGGAAKYFVKYTFFTHYLDFQTRFDIYQLLSDWKYSLMIIMPILFLGVYSLFKKKMKTGCKVTLVMVVMFFIGVLPVLNLYFINIHIYENDRYGYFASQFLYLAEIALILELFNKVKYFVCLLLISIHCIFAVKTVDMIGVAGDTMQTLLESFNYYEYDDIVISGLYENHYGIYMFRDFSDIGIALKESLDWQKRQPYEGNIRVLSQYNMVSPSKHLDVDILDEGVIQAWNTMPGSWFWRKGIGMSSYKSNGIDLEVKNEHYTAIVDTIGKKHILLNLIGDKWEVVK